MPREKEKARASETLDGSLMRAESSSRSSDRIERHFNEAGGRWFESSREHQHSKETLSISEGINASAPLTTDVSYDTFASWIQRP